jgi:hypothetical protein
MTIRTFLLVSSLNGLCLIDAALADAVVPDRLSYQGNVTDAAGNPIGSAAAVNRTVHFKVYEAASSGNPVWAEQQTVTISSGEFSVAIGSGSGISGLPGPSAPASKVATISSILTSPSKSYYLGITIDDGDGNISNDKEIAPRQQLLSGAFALRAKTAEAVASSAISSTMIADGAVASVNLASDSVVTGKIIDGAINSAKIADGAIASADLAPNSVTSAKIADASIATADLAEQSVARAKIAPNAISSYLIEDGSIATADLGPNSVDSSKITDASVATADLANGAVTVDKLNASSIGIWNLNGSSAHRTSGSVGIGTSTPAAPLHVNSTSNSEVEISGTTSRMELRDTDHRTSYWIHNSDGSLYFLWNRGTGDSTWNSERPLTLQNGWVGIGTSTPRAPLDVAATFNTTISSYGRLTTNGATDDNGNVSGNLSIQAEGGMFASRYDVTSDERIKRIVGPASGTESLALLDQIQITDYHYVDTPAQGSRLQRKVIAQQVESVLPFAVSAKSGVVPDIFQNADAANGWINLPTSLKVGERVRLIHSNSHELLEVLETTPSSFRVSLDANVREVFVYGREVHDLRSVDYDAISMINVSATQELHRRVRTLEERLAAIEKRFGSN